MKKILMLVFISLISFSGYSDDLTGVKIYVNPGHGGYNGANDRNVITIPYAENDTLGFWESSSNLTKGLALRDRLEAAGATVYMSRVLNRDEDDRSLSEIAEEANANNVDAFLSIHSNALGTNIGTNYLLLLFHGTDAEPTVAQSKPQAYAAWPRLIENPLTVWTYYQTSTNIRGDFSFYGNDKGLGVLRPLIVPGFLSEGSFHDYKPETHRLLNKDYKKLEADRFYKYFCDYFGVDLPQTGTISGWVKGKDQRIDNPLFTYKAASDDQWLPLNGSQIKLMNVAGDSINNYTVDSLYNGIFTFFDLTPGDYKLSIIADEHETIDTTITVTAAEETPVKVLMFNPNLPLYKEIPPDYPEPEQEAGVLALNHYDFTENIDSDLSWLNGENIRKVTYHDEKLYVLTEEPKIHVVNAIDFSHIKELDLTGISGGLLPISDINFTADGYLLACNKDTISLPETKDRYFKVYSWDNDDAAPSVLFETQYQGNWANGIVGETFAVSGSRWKCSIYVPSVTASASKKIRVLGLLYEDNIQLGYKYMIDNSYTEDSWGENLNFTISPIGSDKIILDSEKVLPTEYQFDWSANDRSPLVLQSSFNEKSGYALQPVASGSNFFRSAEHVYMAAPNCDANQAAVGVVLFDVTEGLDNAEKVSDFLPEGGLGSVPSPYMFATGLADGYDKDLIVLADKQGAKRFKTVVNSNANVYASELNVEEATGGNKLHFTLNDDIQGGEINVLNNAGDVVYTQALPALSKGVNSVDLVTSDIPQGTYNWSITVNAPTVDRPYKFTDNSSTQLQFYSPRGVAVDNSFESPLFGRVYASETIGGGVTNRTTSDGVYILNAALEDVTNQGANGYGGAVTWGGSSSPMRLAVAPDGKVYITDFSDSHSGIWKMDAENPTAAFIDVFDGSTRNDKGLAAYNGVTLHGSISHCWLTGTGEDTKLFTFDEDYIDGVATNTGNLLQYNIGELATPWQEAPSAIVYSDIENGNLQWNMNSCIAPDANGGWWISQYRAEDKASIPSLIHVNSSGTVDFNSGETPTLIGNSRTGGMAVTENGKILAMGSKDEVKVFEVIFDGSGIPNLSLLYKIKPAMGTNTVGIAFDKALNLYVISNSSERLGVWALPKVENKFTTPAPSQQTITILSTGFSNNNTMENTIKLYPNPVIDRVTVKSESTAIQAIKIYDVNGRLVMQESVMNQEKVMNLSELAPGTYLFRIETEKGVTTKRILKK